MKHVKDILKETFESLHKELNLWRLQSLLNQLKQEDKEDHHDSTK